MDACGQALAVPWLAQSIFLLCFLVGHYQESRLIQNPPVKAEHWFIACNLSKVLLHFISRNPRHSHFVELKAEVPVHKVASVVSKQVKGRPSSPVRASELRVSHLHLPEVSRTCVAKHS